MKLKQQLPFVLPGQNPLQIADHQLR